MIGLDRAAALVMAAALGVVGVHALWQRAEIATLSLEISKKDQAIAEISAASRVAIAQADAAVAAARADAARRRTPAAMAAAPAGGDRCARVLDVDRRLLESLR